jgi:hypothetical protein
MTLRVKFEAVATSLAIAFSALADAPPAAWTVHYNGLANRGDAATKIALGPDGTATVVGPSDDAAGIEDIATVRYDAAGNVLWAARYNGEQDWIDVPEGVGVDAAGNAYVLGTSWGGRRFEGGTDWDYVVIKYNPDGSTAWVQRYNGAGNWADTASALAVDAAGSAYVAGFAFKEPDQFDRFATHFHVAKYETDGTFAWEVLYDLDPHFGAGARDVWLAPDGNILATGLIAAQEGGGTQDDIVTLKISPQGQVLWTAQWDSPGEIHGLDDAALVRTDRLGNVYVLGSSFSNIGNRNFDATLLKYTPDGVLRWAAFMDFIRADGFSELIDDEAGNLYLSGGWDNETDVDGFLVSFTSSGQERWRYVFDGPATFDFQEALSVMRGPDGLLYVGIDWQHADDAVYDYTIAVHDTDGNHLDLWRYDTGSHSDTFVSLGGWAMDDAGNIHIAGYSFFDDTFADFTTLKVPTQEGVPGDIDGDGDVDLADLATLLAAYGACAGDPGFDPAADLDQSGCVGLSDLAILLANYAG